MAAGDQTFGLRLTDTAKVAYLELLDYFLKHYSMARANELAESLLDAPLQLIEHPFMGPLEPTLAHRSHAYRFILFQRSNRATIKIIDYLDEANKIIYITDFFPTEMHPENVRG